MRYSSIGLELTNIGKEGAHPHDLVGVIVVIVTENPTVQIS
jgi:hypothetical protein